MGFGFRLPSGRVSVLRLFIYFICFCEVFSGHLPSPLPPHPTSQWFTFATLLGRYIKPSPGHLPTQSSKRACCLFPIEQTISSWNGLSLGKKTLNLLRFCGLLESCKQSELALKYHHTEASTLETKRLKSFRLFNIRQWRFFNVNVHTSK